MAASLDKPQGQFTKNQLGMDVNETYCGGYFAMYTAIRSLFCTPETNIMLYVNSVLI